jgi:glycosyltransferase involved in cell wall biosynthesis
LAETITHIVFLTPGFAESEKDSTTIPALQVYLKSLSESLSQTRLTVISFQFPFVAEKYVWNGISVFPLNGRNKKYKKLIVWNKAKALLRNINKKTPIDFVHSFWLGECSFIAEKFAKRNGIKHLITAMGQDVLKPNRYAKLLLKSNSKIITLSNNHCSDLKQNFNLDSQIIPWGIATYQFPERQKITIDILGVGSLNTVKNYVVFVEAVSAIIKLFPKVRVEIIGEGHKYNELQKVIQHKGLEENITLLGKLSREQVLLKMAKAKILLHTSNYESFGYVFLEALYSGMHIVSFDVGTAQNSMRWHVYKNKKELFEGLLKTMFLEEKTERELLCSIEDTVFKYAENYNA